jgi:putative transposase
MMQAIGRRYVRGFNLRHGRTGTPWEGRFRSTVVDASQHFLDCLRFVEGPPADGADARWSSAAHHLGLRADPLIAEHPAFWSFGNTPFEREASYQRAMQGVLAPDDRARVADAVIKGWALGSSDFASRVSEQSGRRAHPVVRGRPRKPSP